MNLKKIQRVSFWTETFTTRQSLNEKFYDAWDFELKTGKHVQFRIKTIKTH